MLGVRRCCTGPRGQRRKGRERIGACFFVFFLCLAPFVTLFFRFYKGSSGFYRYFG